MLPAASLKHTQSLRKCPNQPHKNITTLYPHLEGEKIVNIHEGMVLRILGLRINLRKGTR